MVITAQTLDDLCRTPFGPMTTTKVETGYLTYLEGRQVFVVMDGETVRIAGAIQIVWPIASLSDEEIADRLQIALTGVALTRPELMTLAADRASNSVTVACWLDASASNEYALAVAVRTVGLMCVLARDAVDQVALGLRSLEELLEAARESSAAASELGASLAETQQVGASTATPPPMLTPVAPRPAMPMPGRAAAAAQTPPLAAPTTIPPATVPEAPLPSPASEGPVPIAHPARAAFCRNCGATLSPSGRFCTSCGTSAT